MQKEERREERGENDKSQSERIWQKRARKLSFCIGGSQGGSNHRADVSIRKLASHVSSASTFTYSSSFSFIWISLHFKAENRSFDLGRRVKS